MLIDNSNWGAAYADPPSKAYDAATDIKRDFPTDVIGSDTANLLKLRKGSWFDEGVDFREPEGDEFTRHILSKIAHFERLTIRRSQINEERHYVQIRKILANALRCQFYFDPPIVSFFRKSGRLSHKPLWFTGTGMRSATDTLAKAEFIKLEIGERGCASTFEATEALLCEARSFGVTENCLSYAMPPERLVRLFDTNRDGHAVEFEPTAKTNEWVTQLKSFNGFLDKQKITIDLSIDEQKMAVRDRNHNRGSERPNRCKPELLKRHLFRQFNNLSFENGGRLYGGWWINIPRDFRPRIVINDQPTIELDYSGCAVRMLYHLRGLEYLDEPYYLEQLAALEAKRGYKEEHYKPAVKALTQALINGASRDDDIMCDLPDGLSFRPKFSRRQVAAMIESKHLQIADAFGSGAGVELQRLESDLALMIVSMLMNEGIVALPIHDSFIVSSTHKDRLFHYMSSTYQDMFGFKPVIKQRSLNQ